MLFIQEHPKTIKLVNSIISISLGNSPSIAQWPSVYAIHTETSSESISPTQALAPHGEMLGPWPSLPSMALLGQATAGGTKKSRGGFVECPMGSHCKSLSICYAAIPLCLMWPTYDHQGVMISCMIHGNIIIHIIFQHC